MKVTATVMFPIYCVEVNVADNATDKEIFDALADMAEDGLQSCRVRPLIVGCSLPRLNEDEYDGDDNE